MGDQYGLPDLRQFMAGRTHFPPISQPSEPFFVQRNVASPFHYEPIMVGTEVLPLGLVGFGHETTSNTVTPTTPNTTGSAATLCGSSQMESGWIGYDGGSSRWPRQETLTLLEIRSRLDSKFKETNQKGPLWDEVSRIMAEEHGYSRSGKKCKEKFENLYKYYKKTKEGKAGRQDGKHYRFFRQLEAIYGEASSTHASVSETHHLPRNTLLNYQTPDNLINHENQEVLQNPKLCESLSFSNNSSELETSSSENNNDDHDLSAIAFVMNQSAEKQKRSYKRSKKNWKAKVEEFVDSQMRKIMDTQEAWMERMMKTIEHREQERVCQEKEWRKQEAARFDQEVHELWVKERAWVEARDAALMEALNKIVGKGGGVEVFPLAEPMAIEIQIHNKNQEENVKEIRYDTSINNINRWTELELSSLVQLRTSLELRFQENGYLEEGVWEEISAKMGCLGYERSAVQCKEKWENISIYYNKTMECNKKRKEEMDLRSINSSHGQEIHRQRPESMGLQLMDDGLGPSSSNVHGSCFCSEGENLWEKTGVKFNKGKNQQV